MDKAVYFDLMERALSAYSFEHIINYFNEVKAQGLSEHGFPRLTANIGILMAHGRRLDLKETFIEMMDFCCQQIPEVKAANDFSVKEIIFCLQELEQSEVVPPELPEKWKEQLKTIDPYKCYSVYAVSEDSEVYNWAAFTMLSEFMREKSGLAEGFSDFIDLQAYSQLRHLDPNRMYRDPNEPMVYDFVTRGLFALLLDQGYQGKYRDIWQEALDATAVPTLQMLSVSGEMPYGGRSNQFIHNEAHVALILEYYAKCFARKNDMKTAGICKAAVRRAVENAGFWLSQQPISHVKNRFPVESRYGCEKYAYFNKYMITAASFFYAASRICDDTILEGELDYRKGMTWQSSENFHKLFLRAGEYSAEYDYRAYYHYDASGLGRLQRKGTPGAICLSVPGTDHPAYAVNADDGVPFAIVPAIEQDGKWLSGADPAVIHRIGSHQAQGESASAVISCTWQDGQVVTSHYHLDGSGLKITVSGPGNIGLIIPAFFFDGMEKTVIEHSEHSLSVSYQNSKCVWQTENGVITETGDTGYNRNGHYKIFRATGCNRLEIRVAIL